jgi:solute:Na+ symporter, SSS family
MRIIDYLIVLLFTLILIYFVRKTKKYTRGVADFLAANRCAGKYILGVSEGLAAVCAISIVAIFESYYRAGFSFAWWSIVLIVVTIIVSMSGWIQYRYRQTRALTMAQFFEMRYNRKFRVFSGIIIFISGTLNFGIFPAVGARFFMYFCGFPSFEVNIGIAVIDLTLMLIMLLLLGIALFFTFVGGQIAVIVTDFIQGSFFNVILCILVFFLLVKIPWNSFIETLSQVPDGQSMLNPFKSGRTKDFNVWYYLIQGFGLFWCFLAWQGSQAYYVSAKNAHEARMGRALGSWRTLSQQMMIPIIAIATYVIMNNSQWISVQSATNGVLENVANETIKNQVISTVILSKFLPIGLLGCFCAVVLAAFISTHDTYLHSWGSIFIQDVYLPLRKNRQLSQQDHMKLLKYSIAGVATFIFLFSLFFAQNTFIFMFFAMTGNIWLGGAGAVIVGGLYWNRGTTAGAFASVWLAVIMTLVYFVGKRFGVVWEFNGNQINEQWLFFITMISTLLLYVVVSLLTCKEPYNLEKLLHRGKYVVQNDQIKESIAAVSKLQKILGINKYFSLSDKVVYLAITGLILILASIFVSGVLYTLIFGFLPDSIWAKFWQIYVWSILSLSVLTTVWFFIGGLKDLKDMFNLLSETKADEFDDGIVNRN